MHWDQIAIAFISTLPATLMALAAVITSLRNAKKIDENTNITLAAATGLVQVPEDHEAKVRVAAESRRDNKEQQNAIASALNGGMDRKISDAVKSVTETAATVAADLAVSVTDKAAQTASEAFAKGFAAGLEEGKKSKKG